MAVIWEPVAVPSPAPPPMLAALVPTPVPAVLTMPAAAMSPSPALAATPMSERPLQVVASLDAPSLNARQRKQVFMHSELFEANGPSPQSMYRMSRQGAVHEQINRVASQMATRPAEVAMPSPADLKATANAGSGILHLGIPHPLPSPMQADAEASYFASAAPATATADACGGATATAPRTVSQAAAKVFTPRLRDSQGAAAAVAAPLLLVSGGEGKSSTGEGGAVTAAGQGTGRCGVSVGGGGFRRHNHQQEAPEFVRFGDGAEAIRVQPAVHDDGAIPREYWATDSGLNWHDVRSELCGRRHQEVREARRNMDAASRKVQELSSEVLGKSRLLEKSTSSPAHEISSQAMKHFHAVDSKLDPHRKAHQVTLEDEGPMSARQRLSRNLDVSQESQFPRYSCPDTRSAGAGAGGGSGPDRAVRDAATDEDERAKSESRRRADRNFSDLFGSQSGERRRVAEREDTLGAANCSFLDPHVEIVNRNRSHWKAISPSSHRETSASQVLPSATQSARGVGGRGGAGGTGAEGSPSPDEKRVEAEERPCWDTRVSMVSGAEIARRARERWHGSKVGQPREHSASERKRLSLASGQFRRSTGVLPAPWDDGRAGPVPQVESLCLHTRSCPPSPLGGSRGTPAHLYSARARKQASLRSSAVF